jgi:hypothetical protein
VSPIDWALRPLDWLPAWAELVTVGAVCGALSMGLVTYATPRRLSDRMRDRATASVYELRLYLDTPSRLLAAFARLLVYSTIRLALFVPAVAVLAWPSLVIVAALSGRFAHAPAAPGDTVVVQTSSPAALLSSRGLAVRLPLRRLPDGSFVGSVSVREPGTWALTRGGARVTADPFAPRVPARWCSGLAALTADAPLDSGGCVTLGLAASERRWLGLPWWGLALLAAIVSGLVLRPRSRP